jgi:DNA-binding Xre family transcriptional regulator
MALRLRLKELLEERDMTPYAFAKATNGRVSMSTAYRVVRMRGRLATFDAMLLEAICDVLRVKPGELFKWERRRRR